jgi:adenosylmethionine-8-amino-7-oxononanoate aminotransferase
MTPDMAIHTDTDTHEHLQALAQRHLWLHFTPMGETSPAAPIVVRGEGCYVYDSEGRRLLDGLSSLFCVNIGHGRADVAEVAARQGAELAYFSNWSFAHPRAIELAARVAGLAPGDLNRVFFTGGGSEAVEAAIKLCRQYHKLSGNPLKTKIIARAGAYHGTSLGALALTGIAPLKVPFEPVMPGACHVPNTNTYRLPEGADPLDLAEAVRERILLEGPETVAAVFMEPVQNSGGCIPPPDGYWQRVREICDKFGVLLVSDEVICSWGRLGTFFGAERYGYQPDVITTAKGLTSAYAPMGAVIATDRVFEPFGAKGYPFMHGLTFGGHPTSAAVALANIDVLEHEGVVDNVRANEGAFRATLESLRDIPIVGDVRGAGYFLGIELVRDAETKEGFGRRDVAKLRDRVGHDLLDRGLICRVDDRGAPVVQLAPPLIAGPEQFAEIEQALRPALTEAAALMGIG